MVTLRIPTELKKKLEMIAKTMGLSKSEVIRMALEKYLDEYDLQNPWELGKDLFGNWSSEAVIGRNGGSLSVDGEEILRKRFKKGKK